MTVLRAEDPEAVAVDLVAVVVDDLAVVGVFGSNSS